MSSRNSRRPSLQPALVAFVAAMVVAGAAWMALRRAAEARLTEELGPWAGRPLPLVDAPIDTALAALGARAFQVKCAACHVVHGEPGLGPDLGEVTRRRSYAWIAAMIARPDSMLESDPVARQLLEAYGVRMVVPGGIDATRVRAILEFLRRADAGGATAPGS